MKAMRKRFFIPACVLLFVLAFWKKTDNVYILVVILELGAVFFLLQSMLTVFPDGESNWYLPLALGLNAAALLLNAAQRKNSRGEQNKKEDLRPVWRMFHKNKICDL